ncbi:hypothetical protein AAFF_G00368590 [Aldrovandia affinis]|uniref:Uncharacterized protein n=1 Tax=Aldrovandia affinis TaxID=143900 RepID=A0AAD7SH48_9TELE|nr:hypothetical protein AAFF_G00368590 [Aldrovandia affinis]
MSSEVKRTDLRGAGSSQTWYCPARPIVCAALRSPLSDSERQMAAGNSMAAHSPSGESAPSAAVEPRPPRALPLESRCLRFATDVLVRRAAVLVKRRLTPGASLQPRAPQRLPPSPSPSAPRKQQRVATRPGDAPRRPPWPRHGQRQTLKPLDHVGGRQDGAHILNGLQGAKSSRESIARAGAGVQHRVRKFSLMHGCPCS